MHVHVVAESSRCSYKYVNAAMGETISTLVFRPPRPTYLKPTRYFFLDVNQDTPLTLTSSLSCVTGSGVGCAQTNGSTLQSSQPPPPTGGRHRIPAFFIKRREATITILFSHGNAEDLGMMHERMKGMARELNVNIMCYDYTGYGYATGSPSEEMCYRNIESAYSYLRNILGIPACQIVLFGRSLGSGPSCYLAAKTAHDGESVAGLILHSPFLSIYRIVINSSNLGMVGDMFPNAKRGPDIRCPVFIIHGTEDTVVPFSHGLELLNCFPEEYRTQPFWAEGLAHNNIEVFMREMFIQRCRHFLQRYVHGAQEDGKPLLVPVEERAVIDASDLSEHQFTINPTWVAYGKKAGQKLLSQAVGSSSQLPPGAEESDDYVDEDEIDSRDDDENWHRKETEGGWGKSAGSHREDWSAGRPMYDNVRAVPIGQMTEGSRRNLLEERRDVHNIFSHQGDSNDGGNNYEEEDYLTYFERANCAIADVTGPDNDEYIDQFMDNKKNPCDDRKQDQQQQLFKKGRKLLFNRSKGSSFASSLR